MKTGIIFDLDGTLLDTLEDLTDAVNRTMRTFGYPERSNREVRRFVGNGVRNLVLRSLPEEPETAELDKIVDFYRDYYGAHSQVKTRPYAGITEALERIARVYPVAVVSNKPDGAVKELCRTFFGDMYALGEVAELPRKPAPDMLYKAMADIGVERCVFVGDGETDVVTARNAGMPCLSVLWGFRDRDVLEAEGGKYFCEEPGRLFAEIEAILEEEESHG